MLGGQFSDKTVKFGSNGENALNMIPTAMELMAVESEVWGKA